MKLLVSEQYTVGWCLSVCKLPRMSGLLVSKGNGCQSVCVCVCVCFFYWYYSMPHYIVTLHALHNFKLYFYNKLLHLIIINNSENSL